MVRKLSLVAIFGMIALFTTSVAYAAATPTLSLSTTGGLIQINVYGGDPNSFVTLFYGTGVTPLGNTDASGSFSTTISASSYNITQGSSVYVVVDGQQSATQAWPAVSTQSAIPTLSQSNVTVGINQSVVISSQGSTTGVFMISNSNSPIANIQTSGQQITVTGNQIGSTVAGICYVGTVSNCTNLYITVQGSSAQTLSFSQNNITLAPGQNTVVTISGGSGGIYLISSNSNPNAVSLSLNGNSITVNGIVAGGSNITFCDQSNTSNCGTLSITVGTSGTGSTTSGSISFSQTNPSIPVGQTATISLSGASGYYVSTNSNPNAVSLTLNSDNTITLTGVANGSATITICSLSNTNACGSLNVAVGATSNTNSAVSFGTTNPTVTVGQTVSVSLSGGTSYFISTNSNTSALQASINGASLSLYGVSAGSASVTVCVSSGGCNTLSVTVTGTSVATQAPVSYSDMLAQIQSMQSQVAQLVAAIQAMESRLVQLATGASATTPSTSAVTQTGAYKFTNYLAFGMTSNDVTELQKRLTAEGLYSGPITGYYGSLTVVAVKKYQAAHGLTQAGYVGPSTQAALNQQ